MTAIGIRFQQVTLAVLAPLVAMLFWSRADDPTNLPKTTLTALAAVLLIGVSVVRTAATRRLAVPRSAVAWAAIAFAVALALVTVTSDAPWASGAGTWGRSDGLLLYGSCVVLFLIGMRALDVRSARWLVYGLLLGGAFSVGYGALQYVGADPVNWADVGISPVIAAFGNPDFESGYLGIVLPCAAWGGLTRLWSLPWRVASAGLALGCLVMADLSSSVQGLLAGAAGAAVLAVAFLLERGGVLARRGLLALGAAVGLLFVLALAGVLGGIGPGQRLVSAGSLTARKWYWATAVKMWAHHPLVGVGPDRYGAYYRAYRPAAAADVSNYSDAAHSVVLHHLATGGLVLGLAYVAFVIAVARAVVLGVLRKTGEERLLVAALGGSWLAYQVQSLVSIDQPGLAVTHWLLAAGVVAAASTGGFRERLLPGAVQPRVRKGRSAPADVPPPLVWSGGTWAAAGAGMVVCVVLAWVALQPLRASYDARGAAVSLAMGDGNAALARYNAATRAAPYESTYWLGRGRFLEQVKQPGLAARSYADGLRHDWRSFDLLVAGARLAKAQGDSATLDRYSRRLAVIDVSGKWRDAVGL